MNTSLSQSNADDQPTGFATTTMQVSRRDGVVVIALDAPPVNVLGLQMMTELHEVLGVLAEDPNARVIVFQSADPEFFIAHVDIHVGEQLDELAELGARVAGDVNVFQAVAELLRHQPQVTIVKLAGIARGGGAEFVGAADMAFAGLQGGKLGQIEALMGIIPGGGATQYLQERVGRNRALEIVLQAGLFDAQTAERYGWINRAVPDDELDQFVDQLAVQIAELPDGVIAAAKTAIAPSDLRAGLKREHEAWSGLFELPEASRLFARTLEQGGQTPAGERRLEAILRGA